MRIAATTPAPVGDLPYEAAAGPAEDAVVEARRQARAAHPAPVGSVGVAGLPRIGDPTKVASKDARVLSQLFLRRIVELEEGTPEYQYVRNTLVELNLSLVKFAATRFRKRADEMDDIIQVGTIGLIKAIDRFDLSREVAFASFALPYILGEIRRFFRDTSWAVHVPRRLQELRIDLVRADETLSHRLDRVPTAADLADYLGLTEQEVAEGLIASNAYTAGSLDAPAQENSGDGENTGSYAERIGEVDLAMERVENLQALRPLVAELAERDRRILHLRFVQERTQSEIGNELGLSQMHVSRLLSRTLKRLRQGMLTEE